MTTWTVGNIQAGEQDGPRRTVFMPGGGPLATAISQEAAEEFASVLNLRDGEIAALRQRAESAEASWQVMQTEMDDLTGQLIDHHKALAQERERVEKLRSIALDYQRAFETGFYKKCVDHACILCDPEATGAPAFEGFRCYFHRAEDVLKETAP